jgi:PAS domain S-box-containing protein
MLPHNASQENDSPLQEQFDALRYGISPPTLSSDSGFYLTHLSSNAEILYINQYLAQFCQSSRESLLRHSMFELIAQDDWDKFLNILELCLRHPEIRQQATLRIMSGTTQKWTDWVFTPKQDSGLPLMIYCVGMDTRRHELMLQNVVDTNMRLNYLMRHIPTIVYGMKPESLILSYVSPNVSSIIGFTADQLIGSPLALHKHIHSDDLAKYMEAVEHLPLLQHENLVYRLKVASGDYRWVSDRMNLLRDEQGQPVEIIGTIHDIHEQIMLTEQLRERDQFLNIIEATAEIAAWEFVPEARSLRFSEGIAGLMDSSGAAVGSDLLFETLPEADRQRVMEVSQGLVEKRQEYDIVHRAITRSGKEIWLRSVGRFDATTLRAYGIVQNITERVRAAEQEQMLAAEQERIQLLQTLLRGLMHDIKTPFSVLNTSVHIIERIAEELLERSTTVASWTAKASDENRTGDMRDRLRLRIELLKQTVSHLNEMTTGIETITGEFSPLREVNLNQLVDSVVAIYQVVAKERRIVLKIAKDPNMPPLLLNAATFGRVIQNLIENAIKYSPEGTEVIILTVNNGQQVIFSVTDRGSGIPANEIPYIFDYQYRTANAQQSSVKGSGLGLSIVKQIVESHGGTIQVESEVGIGTTFEVFLPLPDSG